jgi:folate-binding protein YgfZ
MGCGQLPATPYGHRRIRLEDVPLHLIRVAIFGIPGVLLAAQAEQAAWLWDTLLERARAQGLRPVGWEALNIVRIEAGCPWYGLDMDEANLLPETGLETAAVSDSKGCYVGQEVIARLSTHGSVSRKLMGLRCEGTVAPARGDAIVKDGDTLGTVTSACLSPMFKAPIALGYVKRPFYEPGTAVQIKHGGTFLAATLMQLPFAAR